MFGSFHSLARRIWRVYLLFIRRINPCKAKTWRVHTFVQLYNDTEVLHLLELQRMRFIFQVRLMKNISVFNFILINFISWNVSIKFLAVIFRYILLRSEWWFQALILLNYNVEHFSLFFIIILITLTLYSSRQLYIWEEPKLFLPVNSFQFLCISYKYSSQF